MTLNDAYGQGVSDENAHDRYIADTKQWQKNNEERFRDPFGWLALTGNYWLHDAENRIGVDSTSVVKLPADFADQPTGSFFVDRSSVELRLDSQSIIQVNGRSAGTTNLTIDSSRLESDGSDRVSIEERIQLQLVRRNGRFAVRVRDRKNAAFEKFPGKRWYEPQPEFRVEAAFTAYEPKRTISITNVKGDQVEMEVVGNLRFRIRDREFLLDAFSESPESLFLVFKDLTSGKSTYAAGRFLTTSAPVDGRVTIDFNKAYNPPCAFSPHALCPLPPTQNSLDIEIVAGELKVQ